MDRYLARQYNNHLPVSKMKEESPISIRSSLPTNNGAISNTVSKTSNMLPLLVYWQWTYSTNSTFNPAIAVDAVTRTFNARTRALGTKLGDRKLEVTVQEVPGGFALVDKAHLIWAVYVFGWDKIYIEPDQRPLKLSYRILNADGSVQKEGTSTQVSQLKREGLGYFQSWKNATSSFLNTYDIELARLSRAAIQEIEQDL